MPDATNGLVSISWYNASGGWIEFSGGGCTLKDDKGNLVGKGVSREKLYLLFAHAYIANGRNMATFQ